MDYLKQLSKVLQPVEVYNHVPIYKEGGKFKAYRRFYDTVEAARKSIDDSITFLQNSLKR